VVATDVPSPDRMQAALGPDGRGWLVYQPDTPDQIRVVRLNARALLGVKPHPRKHKTHTQHPKPKHH
jgi:hypothetical protein